MGYGVKSGDMRVLRFQKSPNAKYRDIIESVIGQLSDGVWSNNSRLNGYWIYAEGSSSGADIIIHKQNQISETSYKNPYVYMSDSDIYRYFARKIKQIALIEIKDNYKAEIEKQFGFRMDLPNEEYKRVSKLCDDYLKDNPFIARGMFKADNSYELTYLSQQENVTLADAYGLYRILTRLMNS